MAVLGQLFGPGAMPGPRGGEPKTRCRWMVVNCWQILMANMWRKSVANAWRIFMAVIVVVVENGESNGYCGCSWLVMVETSV